MPPPLQPIHAGRAWREPAIWVACPTCWGQRRIFEDRNGEGLVAHRCPTCLGLGERIAI